LSDLLDGFARIFDIPDGENATSLGKTGLLGNTADALLEN